MRIAFDSSHVHGDYSSGLLTIGIRIEDEALGQTISDEIFFEVPSDFHTHNDAVAAALMTLAGRRYQKVRFNFPISSFCAETLRAYYGEIRISPVDPSAAPRRPGSRIAVNFSGGLDSTAVWLLMRELYGDDFAVITSEYGRALEFERRGYGHYKRDVSCRTNLRERRFNREGRFNFCVPLLFAEYLDLGGITTGHDLAHTSDGLNDYRGRQPAFVKGDLAVNAGGLDDIHLLRSISPVGVAKIIMALGRDRIERALAASSPPNSGKPYTGALLFRLFHQDAGLPLPTFLQDYPPLRWPSSGNTLRPLYVVKRTGSTEVMTFAPQLQRYDLSFLNDVTLHFLERYNPVYVGLLEQPLRGRATDLFHHCGIRPYDERDWYELGIVRRFLKANVPRFKDLEE